MGHAAPPPFNNEKASRKPTSVALTLACNPCEGMAKGQHPVYFHTHMQGSSFRKAGSGLLWYKGSVLSRFCSLLCRLQQLMRLEAIAHHAALGVAQELVLALSRHAAD